MKKRSISQITENFMQPRRNVLRQTGFSHRKISNQNRLPLMIAACGFILGINSQLCQSIVMPGYGICDESACSDREENEK